jgi:hypothetical protein
MAWQLLILLLTLVATVAVVVLFSIAALTKALGSEREAAEVERQHHREIVESLIVGWHQDREAMIRAIIAKNATEAANMERVAQAPEVAAQHVKFARSLDPRNDAMIDPETGEQILLAGMGAG